MSTINPSDYGFSSYPSWQSANSFANKVFSNTEDRDIFLSMIGFETTGEPSSLENWYTAWIGPFPSGRTGNGFDILRATLISNTNNFSELEYWTAWILVRYFSNPALSYNANTGYFDPVYRLNDNGLPDPTNCKQPTGFVGSGKDSLSEVTGCVYPKVVIPGRLEYTEMLQALHSWISGVAGAASSFLSSYAKSLQLTRADISASPAYLDWFGCFSPDTDIPGVTKLPKPCDPLCQRLTSIKLYANGATSPEECNGTICIIDNVSVTAAANTGSVEFNQICPACADNSQECRCVVDVTVPGVLDKIGVDGEVGGMNDPVVFTQYCPNSECIQFDPITGKVGVVKCNQNVASTGKLVDGITGTEAEAKNTSFTGLFWVIFGIVIGIFLLFFFASTYDSEDVKVVLPRGKSKGINTDLSGGWRGRSINSMNLTSFLNYNS